MHNKTKTKLMVIFVFYNQKVRFIIIQVKPDSFKESGFTCIILFQDMESPEFLLKRSLSSSKTCYRNSERRTGNIVQTDIMAKFYC